MQQVRGAGIRPAGQEQGVDPAFLVRGEIERDTLRLLFLAALCAGLVAAAISFVLLSRGARDELADLAANNAQLLDGRLRRAIELAALAPTAEFPAGGQIQSRLQGQVAAGGAAEIHAVVHVPGDDGQQERGLTLTLTLTLTLSRAMLARVHWRDVPHLERVDLWVLATEPLGIWYLAGSSDKQSSNANSAAFLSGCGSNYDGRPAVVRGRVVACAFVPSAASYLLASADQVSFYHSTLRRSLTLFLITGLLFYCGVIVAHRGQRRYLTTLFTAADSLRQDIFRRRESIKHLQEGGRGSCRGAAHRRLGALGHAISERKFLLA